MSLDRGSLGIEQIHAPFLKDSGHDWDADGCCILAAAVWILVTWMFVEGPTRLQMKPSLLIPMPTRTAFVSWTRWHSGQLQTQLQSNGCTQAQHLAFAIDPELTWQNWKGVARTHICSNSNIHIHRPPWSLWTATNSAALRMCRFWPLCRCSIHSKFQWCRIYPYESTWIGLSRKLRCICPEYALNIPTGNFRILGFV